jgi:hypothetical protein
MKRILKFTKVFTAIVFTVFVITNCNKKQDELITPTERTPQTGNFSLTTNNGAITGNEFSASFMGTSEFTNIPTLEVHLSSNTGQLDIYIENPRANTTYTSSNISDGFSMHIANINANGQNLYSAAASNNIEVILTELSATRATGTIKGSLKNINDATAANLAITNGQFEINF